MIIKEIKIEKSRTILVEGLMSRDKYRKITISMTADICNEDYEMNVKGEVEQYRNQLSQMVDEAISHEIKKFKKK